MVYDTIYIHNEYVSIDTRIELLLLRVLFSSNYLEIKKISKGMGIFVLMSEDR